MKTPPRYTTTAALAASTLLLITTTSCTLTQPPTRAATPEQQRTITNEFWDLFPQTIQDTGTDPTLFIYESGDPYSEIEVRNRGFNPLGTCGDDTDGTTLYQLSAYVSYDTANLTQTEYQTKINHMKEHWESQGHEVQNIGQLRDAEEIVFYSENGTKVAYMADPFGERVSIETDCVLTR